MSNLSSDSDPEVSLSIVSYPDPVLCNNLKYNCVNKVELDPHFTLTVKTIFFFVFWIAAKKYIRNNKGNIVWQEAEMIFIHRLY